MVAAVVITEHIAVQGPTGPTRPWITIQIDRDSGFTLVYGIRISCWPAPSMPLWVMIRIRRLLPSASLVSSSSNHDVHPTIVVAGNMHTCTCLPSAVHSPVEMCRICTPGVSVKTKCDASICTPDPHTSKASATRGTGVETLLVLVIFCSVCYTKNNELIRTHTRTGVGGQSI